MTKKNYGAPTGYVKGKGTLYATAAAADLAIGAENGSGANTALVDHYFTGKGGIFDLTSNELLKSEVMDALIHKRIGYKSDILDKVEAEAWNCDGVEVRTVGDNTFSPIAKENFKSSILAIRSAKAGISKKCNGAILCLCDRGFKIKIAIITCHFEQYFYDQFADAAHSKHKKGRVEEFVGGTQFDSVGAWGIKTVRAGVYR